MDPMVRKGVVSYLCRNLEWCCCLPPLHYPQTCFLLQDTFTGTQKYRKVQRKTTIWSTVTLAATNSDPKFEVWTHACHLENQSMKVWLQKCKIPATDRPVTILCCKLASTLLKILLDYLELQSTVPFGSRIRSF
jgi:hypothetical protein